jgi:hypothetical protein
MACRPSTPCTGRATIVDGSPQVEGLMFMSAPKAMHDTMLPGSRAAAIEGRGSTSRFDLSVSEML